MSASAEGSTLLAKIVASGAVLMQPERTSSLSAWTEHIPFAAWLMETLRPRVVVELGVHAGVSLCAFAQAAAAPARLIGVDTWEGDVHTNARSDAYESDVHKDLAAFVATHHPDRVELWRQSFDNAVARLSDGEIDLLHIDGLHTYEAVRHDFEAWRAKLSDRAIVLFHDTAERGGDFGVWRFWEEISAGRETFAFEHGHGLGVLVWGANAPQALKDLARLGPNLQPISDFFARLGRALGAEQDLRVSEERRLIAESHAIEHLRAAQVAERDNAELVETRHAVQHARSVISALRGSASWRLTAPLRWVALAARSRRRPLILREPEREGALTAHALEAPHGYPAPGWALARASELGAGARLRIDGGPAHGQEIALDGGARENLIRLPDDYVGLTLLAPTDGGAPTEFALKSITPVGALTRILWSRRRAVGSLGAILKREGLGGVLRRLAKPFSAGQIEDYPRWVERYDTPTTTETAALRARIEVLRQPPRFSVLTPVYNTPPAFLEAMLNSVRAQLYPHWQLCLADDASTAPYVRQILDKHAREDDRITIEWREQNGHISAASNSALAKADGDFLALLDHDDMLPAHALATMAEAIHRAPSADIFYSDEDKIDEGGKRFDPYFKPDWNEELLFAQNYISHLGVYRARLVRELGGFRLGFEGSQDYDLILRASAATRGPIVHVPHILYHWRLFAGAETFSSTQASTAAAAARAAIVERFAARGEKVHITDGVGGYHRLERPAPERWPSVTAIVPTRDHDDVLRRCVDGLLNETDYPNLDLIVVNNGSVEPSALAYLRQIARNDRVAVIDAPGPFNFSRLNNLAAAEARGDLLLLLNNDISMTEPSWLKEMVVHAVRPEVGAVGARLLYPDGSVQHAGVIIGMGGVAGHVHRTAARDDPGYFGRLKLAQDVSCVTAACMLLRREIYSEVGGLDEENLAIAFNDVDFCLRMRARGYKIIWTPHAELYHWESKSRGSDMEPGRYGRFVGEVEYMHKRWGATLAGDPFFNPNLDLNSTTPRLGFPPRIKPPWV